MANRPETQREVLGLLERWASAERMGDATTLDTLLDPEFLGVGPRGFVLTRDQWLDRYRTGVLQNQAFTWEDVQIRDHGDSAVTVGIQAQQTTYQAPGQPRQDSSGRFRGTLVAVHESGNWRVASVHLSPLTEPQR